MVRCTLYTKHYSVGFHKFTDKFLKKLKLTLPQVIASSKKEFDWSAVDGAKKYDLELIRKEKVENKAREQPLPTPTRDSVKDKWRGDHIEKARRLWEWWRPRVAHFPTWAIALRLVGLVQASSAFVERVFSQMKLIIETIGVSALEATLEARLMLRVNKILQEMNEI
jgi:hypothetical protein